MNVKTRCRLGVVLSLLAQAPQARDWVDMLTTPLTDPLLTLPPRLESEHAQTASPLQTIDCEAQPWHSTTPLTLSTAIELAICHNPQLQSSWASIKIQAAQLGEARAAYLPTLNAGISHLKQKTQYPESKFQVESERTSAAHYATLTWRLLDFGGRDANRRTADAWLEAALASHDAALQKTFAKVIAAYFDAQSSKASWEAKERNLILSRQILETTRKREARGLSAQSDIWQAQTAFAKAELESARALGSYEKTSITLLIAIGLPTQSVQQTRLALADDYQDSGTDLQQDLKAWLELAQQRHPALIAVQSQLDATREKLQVIRSEGLPSLDFTHSEYINGRPTQGLSMTQTQESVIGLTVNIPVFDGFARTYKVRGAQAQIQIKEAELLDVRNQILGEVAKTHADAMASLRNLESSRQLLDAAHGALENVRRQYDRGIADILQMLQVQLAFADAGQERVRALAEWRSAKLRLLADSGIVEMHDFDHSTP